MKKKFTRGIFSVLCVALIIFTASAAAFAADENSSPGNGPAPQNGAPANMQEMKEPPAKPEGDNMQAPPAKPEGENNQLPPEKPADDGLNKPADAPQGKQGGERPANAPKDMPNGEKPADGELPEIPKDGKFGPEKEVYDAIDGITDDTSKGTLEGLMSEYKSAVDAERESTDESAKLEAAGKVKELVDIINSALKEIGASVSINTPAEKPEMPKNA